MLRSLIYLDAFVPGDGERVADYMLPAACETLTTVKWQPGTMRW